MRCSGLAQKRPPLLTSTEVYERRVAHRLIPDGECLVWSGATNDKGYGQTTVGRKRQYVHRVAWEYHNRLVVPPGHVVMHTCDNPACASPAHLRAVTQTENMRDAARKGRTSGGERSAQAVLAWDQVDEIRRRYAAGESQGVLAQEFGVVRQNVSRIVNGHAWKPEHRAVSASAG